MIVKEKRNCVQERKPGGGSSDISCFKLGETQRLGNIEVVLVLTTSMPLLLNCVCIIYLDFEDY